jgi:hypothetical protein
MMSERGLVAESPYLYDRRLGDPLVDLKLSGIPVKSLFVSTPTTRLCR